VLKEKQICSFGKAFLSKKRFVLKEKIRLHKLATLQKSLVKRQLGTLTQEDLSKVREKIKQIFASI
jgi:hypothetical protein